MSKGLFTICPEKYKRNIYHSFPHVDYKSLKMLTY
jgi:hypothetical protein